MAKPGFGSPARMDWDGIRRRLDAMQHALSGASEASPERIRQVLEARAVALARPATSEPETDAFQVVWFDLAGETYALDATYVWEVFPLATLSLLPGAKPPVFGVTVWRGALLTILDLRQVLGLQGTGLTDLSRVIVLGGERPAFGVLADAVREVMPLRRGDVREPPEGVAVKREYLEGITGDAVLLLAGEQLLERHGQAALRRPGPA